jgi:hypothetical protein
VGSSLSICKYQLLLSNISTILSFLSLCHFNSSSSTALVSSSSSTVSVSFDHRQSLLQDIAETISALYSERYQQTLQTDTDFATLQLLILSMVQSPLSRLTQAWDQVASSAQHVIQEVERHLPAEEALSYWSLVAHDIDTFRQESHIFQYVVDASLRSFHNQVTREDSIIGG